ncbi:type III secretion system chaperone family protein [Parasphingopyxis marina]|uniref:YbjN domain-containing protein n=1 Tax=Parasphingopyxis marina TaxID=2761622 RepID=A0A842HZT2_9SPHN|nr:YbjN domain-containing protein [Parasphingopyxis marina]MBC2778385.1 YbjN domain-containing protein [Parasphingopyxis marina]
MGINVDELDDGRLASAPLDVLEDYFTAHGWQSERNGDEEIVTAVKGSWAQYEMRAVWRREDRVLQFLALPDIRVPEEKRALVYETFGLVNEQLWLGHFEMWAASGMILFRHAALLDPTNQAGLSLEQAEMLIEAALDECERFYPVFQFVLWGDKSPQEAIEAALIDTAGEA